MSAVFMASTSLNICCLCGDDKYKAMPTTSHNTGQFTRSSWQSTVAWEQDFYYILEDQRQYFCNTSVSAKTAARFLALKIPNSVLLGKKHNSTTHTHKTLQYTAGKTSQWRQLSNFNFKPKHKTIFLSIMLNHRWLLTTIVSAPMTTSGVFRCFCKGIKKQFLKSGRRTKHFKT